jgi:hypothetical protein
MIYAATVFWLMVIVFCAWGVHRIWSGLVRPRVVNVILLPGTLVAQMGHVLGLLVPGATVHNTTLIKDDETGDPQQSSDAKPKIPFIGPVVIGMLPLITCALAIFAAAYFLRSATVQDLTSNRVATALPLSLAAFWELLRTQITLMENTLAAALSSSLNDWHAWLFIYLVICLTVRMAPFPGNLRGSLGAIVVLGILAAVIGHFVNSTRSIIENGWSVLSLSVAMLMLLLVFSLMVRGGVSLVQLLSKNA